MKNFKKNIGFAVILVLFASMAIACSNDNDDSNTNIDTSKFIGTWKGTTTVNGGSPGTNILVVSSETEYDFQDGTGTSLDKGTYTATSTEFSTKGNSLGNRTYTYTLNGSTLTLTFVSSGYTFVSTLIKQ